MLLLAVLRSILGVDPALNVVKYKKGSSVRFHKTNHAIKALRLCNSCRVYEHKTKDMQGQGPFNFSFS